MNPNGICVLKKFISENKSQILKAEIFEEIKKDCYEIIRNPFGNYIVQYIIDEWQEIYCEDIFYFVLNNLKSLILEKFSSKVIQKIVEIIGKVINFFNFFNFLLNYFRKKSRNLNFF